MGCTAAQAPYNPPPDPDILASALTGEALFGVPVSLDELPEVDLFTVTPPMRRFAQENVSQARTSFQRAEALQRALLLSTNLGIRYYPYLTTTPEEVFKYRVANCVSFTLLYVNLARYLGLDAYFNEVDVPDVWDMREDKGEDVFILLRHVNAGVHLRDRARSKVIIDLEMERYSPVYPQREISDQLMAALFHNNRAIELMSHGEMRQAFLHLRKAVLLSEERAYIWSNFAVIYRRLNILPEAEALYLRALEVSPTDLTATNNLGSLYVHMGRHEEAERLAERAERYRRNNPYYYFTLARQKIREEDWQGAYDHLRTAKAMQPEEPRFFELEADIQEHWGNLEQAQQLRERAKALQPMVLD